MVGNARLPSWRFVEALVVVARLLALRLRPADWKRRPTSDSRVTPRSRDSKGELCYLFAPHLSDPSFRLCGFLLRPDFVCFVYCVVA